MLSARPISLNADVDVPTHTILNTKTPGRKGAKGRNALQENAIHHGSKTVLTKKNVLQTPFRPGPVQGKKPLVSVSVTRPLGDKTPFPNRVAGSSFGNAGKTPGLKLSKLALLAPPEAEPNSLSPDVAPLLRPSSTRKSLRGRLSQNFKTPFTKGNHWDVSPGDMEGIGGGLMDEAKPETEAAAVDEDEEIEYMPPTAIELPYEPPFEMPDYKTMGQGLFELGHGGLVDDTADIFYSADIEEQIDAKALLAGTGFTPGVATVHELELPELEDDSPFARKPPARKPGTPAATAKPTGPLSRAPSSRLPTIRTQPPARPATTVPASHLQSRPSSRSTTSSGVGTPAPAPARAAPALVVAPGQTRTSALRAAKAAASSNNATTPNPARPTAASTGARPATAALARRPGVTPSTSVTTGARAPVRTASTSLRPAATNGPAASGARPRSATVSGRARPVGATGIPKSKVDEDPLAAMLKKHVGDDDDFRFDI
ncbi:hypothetical protein L226DRAFT_575445 [Lentinus tigrinus ALCF2SS1-7]|uniref:Uncharacterized protein n=1 Tax=Lentinus tigrinus ALCF2SS1-6 TaxID=1328759 RepID=A0A5C2RV18_9APHY|nr:hypothetical protein L227DRAFT_657609 [Lentinus tigrinus ALCF2SS1-6]RPD69616.1 hypothetical protein L226DRAFT_575445 [Lentinus tigrinus ALCF2SS1-7]